MRDSVIRVENISLDFPLVASGLRGLVSTVVGVISPSRRRNFRALDQIDLDIKEGEVFGVIGNNGCGKSTLLRSIAGIYTPDKGRVLVSGRPFLLAGLGTGFSDQLSGRQNAHLYGSMLGHSKQVIDEALPEIIEYSELDEFIDRQLKTYSSGMKARLGLAVASTMQPDVLLIDEVLGVGDPIFKEKSKLRLQKMVEGASTVVIVSHSFGLLSDICSRILLLEKGRIKCLGTPQESIDAYYGR